MMPSIEPERDSASPSSRSAVIARFLRALTVFSPVALMLALFLMWKQYQMPFATAFEICFVAGLTIYVVLGTISSMLLTVARLQPPQVLLRHLLALVSLGIFAALRYIHGLGIIKSVIAWAIIYFGVRLLVGRVESRAARHFASR